MLINLNGDTVIETDSVIGFHKGNRPDVFIKHNGFLSKYYISIYLNEFQDNGTICVNFDSAESRDAVFQKLENLLKVTDL